jgi:hypothetical protein
MSTLRVNAIESVAGLGRYTAQAWVNFNGTGTVAIRAAGNVSSITDHTTGDYTVNFANALPDANYSVTISSAVNATTAGVSSPIGVAAPTASALRLRTYSATFIATDSEFVNVTFHR